MNRLHNSADVLLLHDQLNDHAVCEAILSRSFSVSSSSHRVRCLAPEPPKISSKKAQKVKEVLERQVCETAY